MSLEKFEALKELTLKIAVLLGYTDLEWEQWYEEGYRDGGFTNGWTGELNGERVAVPDFPYDANGQLAACAERGWALSYVFDADKPFVTVSSSAHAQYAIKDIPTTPQEAGAWALLEALEAIKP